MTKMYEFHEAGYKVMVGSMYGDYILDFDLEYDEDFEKEYDFHHVDEDKKIAYFYDNADYDD
jgi:hypothetical protein